MRAAELREQFQTMAALRLRIITGETPLSEGWAEQSRRLAKEAVDPQEWADDNLEYVRKWADAVLEYPEVHEPSPAVFQVAEALTDGDGQPLPGFYTFDRSLANRVRELRTQLSEYLADGSRRRPHNVLLFASPGSGKSYFVDCLSKAISIPVTTANLSGYDVINALVDRF
jgi:hypothetical protein